MVSFADDLAWLCEHLRAEEPIVVGHSMGGIVTLVLAAPYAFVSAMIFMLDMPTALIVGPLPAINPRWQMIGFLRRPAYRAAACQYAEAMFLPTDDGERRAQIVEQMTAAPQLVLASSFEQA